MFLPVGSEGPLEAVALNISSRSLLHLAFHSTTDIGISPFVSCLWRFVSSLRHVPSVGDRFPSGKPRLPTKEPNLCEGPNHRSEEVVASSICVCFCEEVSYECIRYCNLIGPVSLRASPPVSDQMTK